MFKIIMIIAVIALAVAWTAYGIWALKVRAEEKKQPRPVSKRLREARNSVDDYAKKLANFEKPTYKRDNAK
jgi:hypothetical protein